MADDPEFEDDANGPDGPEPPPSTFEVNFGRPMALFPLNGVVLMPHSPFMLHVFEPRYREMVRDVMRGAKQFAMAVFEGDEWKTTYHGRPALRPVVCVGQVLRCEQTDDGRYLLIVQGLCRARIVRELSDDPERPYRRAILEPLGVSAGMSAAGSGAGDAGDADSAASAHADEPRLRPFRRRLRHAMEHDRLHDLRDADEFVRLLSDEQIPMDVLVEILGNRFLTDQEQRYRLLASEDPVERAAMVSTELMALQRLLEKAAPQRTVEAPKGVSWN